ncbi:choline TMA-lyase-activating enzyme [Enterococcus sp. PF1-24]|uniref:choline TMA-lyase-activating enzyme n=1 Tax=unclassified Enterococcus TaxID=2608891 RepID=UPI0024742B99|nr:MULTISPECIES: choline TMA-lyase-activating enzyme [unclassified Enterococcus]MDH6364083.1 choline TMA-lyase-activating enzyme [Enterococcus sp. PFB1-1]MDH6401184.1 choline TMA-lyase-activating enzyme [Enterococcus sp. PF1-24]
MEKIIQIQRKARIFNIQKYSIYDGPGIRTLFFFKGCPLRCRWCSNPESIERKYEVMFQKNLCIDCGACVAACPMKIHKIDETEGFHYVDRTINCNGCRACEKVCPKKALSIAGDDRLLSDLIEIAKEDMMFYQTSGGGVTLGGGEVTTQAEFASNLLMECKNEGINTAIETCGHSSLKNLLKIAEFCDLFLFDLKHIDPDKHLELTGVRNERILENLSELIQRRYNVKVRMPLMKGLNHDAKTIQGTIEFLMPFKDYPNFQGIDLLPYHKLGVNKYDQLDKVYPITEDLSMSDEDLDLIEQQISHYDFPVKVIRH